MVLSKPSFFSFENFYKKCYNNFMKKSILIFICICLSLGIFAEDNGKCNITSETQKIFNKEDLKMRRALFLYDLYPEADFDKCLEFAEDKMFAKIAKQLKEKGYKIDNLINMSYIN